jgi:hypothetical protein
LLADLVPLAGDELTRLTDEASQLVAVRVSSKKTARRSNGGA